MTEIKTKPTTQKAKEFLETIEHPTRKSDGYTLLKLMIEITKEKPIMWGSSIIGFGTIHYKTKSGQEADWPKTGFSPRKRSLSIYVTTGFNDFEALLSKLGKHRLGKGCLYINKLADVDLDVLREIIQKAYETEPIF